MTVSYCILGAIQPDSESVGSAEVCVRWGRVRLVWACSVGVGECANSVRTAVYVVPCHRGWKQGCCHRKCFHGRVVVRVEDIPWGVLVWSIASCCVKRKKD